ncbi:polyprenol phosphomannose-dependent alpha 1,6 mannosyltransferase MptB [Daejeonella oryzae]|uniref:polyprenol phosphomannose-dependent alpha 1,6 mannosyltransferase MptB n=1 Tax=Daejeonella oryzae TaxID=1122943 RepID=UPI0003FB98AD|nr:polyprenol phosphomannose-dependent alpha 1,6 mannosyltransferase MptB [Daejeonella oryzae]
MPQRLSYSLLLLSLPAYILMGYDLERSNFLYLFSIYGSLFIIYFYLIRFPECLNLKTAVFAGMIFRVVFLFCIPNLSDDIYRFIWDGRIQQLGINPFTYTPRQLISIQQDTYLQSIFPHLNSPDYHSVYPQILQAFFRIAVEIAGDSMAATSFILKLIILFFEAGSIFLIIKLLKLNNLNPNGVYIYLLNPLVIIELTGNIHFEAIMIFFILLAAIFISQKKYKTSIAAMVMAIQAKLIPAIGIPLLIREIGFWKTLLYGLACLILFLVISPYLWGGPESYLNFLTSLKLYYGKFEFNGSIYSILRGIGWYKIGHNPIETVSKIMIGLSLGGFALVYYKNRHFLSGMFWLLIVYLLFSAIVHPWYLAALIALSPFVRFRFALLWTALIPLTYITYQTRNYQQNYWIIAFEYSMVLIFLVYEWQIMNKEKSSLRGVKICTIEPSAKTLN